MDSLLFFDIYELLVQAYSFATNNDASKLRMLIFEPKNKLVKVAFDMRRINTIDEYNPRRGLQNWQRDQKFITASIEYKILNFKRLQKVLNEIKDKYREDNKWLDSNARTLLNAVDNSLRQNFSDSDFVENQPGISSFDYLIELLHVRYHLTLDDLQNKSEDQLKEILLSKDENLMHPTILKSENTITKQEIMSKSHDTLMEKLFTIAATPENKSVKRTITITIEDNILDK